jgi:hypothetical protein
MDLPVAHIYGNPGSPSGLATIKLDDAWHTEMPMAALADHRGDRSPPLSYGCSLRAR